MKSERHRKIVFSAVMWCLLLTVPGGELTLRIIQTTDLHGSTDHGRLARVAALAERETQAAGGVDKSLRIDCGDLIQGTWEMTFPAGRELMIRFLNFLSYDVWVPGNHDFEFGASTLLPLLRQFRGSVLALNLNWPGAPVQPWKMFRRNQLNIAVIGIAYPALDRMFIPPVLGRARPLDAGHELEKIMPQVMRARPDLIVLAVHAGEQTRFGPDFSLFDLIRKYPQIDLVLCGHSHQPEAGRFLGRNSWRMQSPALGNGIGVAEIVFDCERRRVVSLRTRLERIDQVPEHPVIKKEVTQLKRKTFPAGRQPVADFPFELRVPEKNEHSSALTELCGKAIMAETGAEVVFYGVNSRFRISPGQLNPFLLFRLVPYADYPVVVGLNSDEIRRILEEQVSLMRKKGMYQAPYGLRFTTLKRKLHAFQLDATGGPPEKGKIFRTAFSSYIFSGSGRCPVLHSIVKSKKAEYFPRTVREITTDYLRKNYPVKKNSGDEP